MLVTAGELVADTEYWGHMSGWGWGWGMMIGFWLLVLIVVGGVVWAIVSTNRPSASERPESRAEAILAERYARGEIDHEEFERRRDELRR
jgi:putative membrane protein